MIKNKIILVLLLIVAGLCGSVAYLNKQNKKLDNSLQISNSNNVAYLDVISKKTNEGRIFKFNIDELQERQDSLTVLMEKIRRDKKIKNSEIKLEVGTVQKIDTTAIKPIIVDTVSCNFNDSIIFNSQTKSFISVENGVLNNRLDIENTNILYVFTKRVYKNNRRNILSRIIHLDFKKIDVYEYVIHNTNDIVKNINTEPIIITQ